MSVEASTTGHATPEYTDGYARIVEVVRWLLVAALVLDVLVGLVTRPHAEPLDQLRADLTAGTAHSVTFGHLSELPSSSLAQVPFGGEDSDTAIVLWRSGIAEYHSASLTTGGPFLSTGQHQPSAGALTIQIEQFARQRGVATHGSSPDALMHWPKVSVGVLLLLVVVLLRGGQPRLATRWATFWLLLTPLHIGMLRTLIKEAPWSPAARAAPEPLPHGRQPDDQRMTGGAAFLVMLLTTVAVQLVLTGLDAIRF